MRRLRMENISFEVVSENGQDILVIRCTLDVKGSMSKSGKSLVLASTRGNVKVPGTDVKLGLNLYKPV
jgi:hypothetical protein